MPSEPNLGYFEGRESPIAKFFAVIRENLKNPQKKNYLKN